MENDLAYANRDFVPDADAIMVGWEVASRDYRSTEAAIGRARLNLAYSDHPRQAMDIYYPAQGVPEGLVVFVHGGYWRMFDRDVFAHLAAGACARGWAVAMPGYVLAPEARVAEITQSIAQAVQRAAEVVAGPVVLTGHSAGGHLVARMGCVDVDLGAVRPRVRRIVPISPLSDLRPLLKTSMNKDLGLDAEEAAAESPALQSPVDGDVLVWVGSAERPAFLDQARWLCDSWPRARLHVEEGRHHFDIIAPLADPDSALVEGLLP